MLYLTAVLSLEKPLPGSLGIWMNLLVSLGPSTLTTWEIIGPSLYAFCAPCFFVLATSSVLTFTVNQATVTTVEKRSKGYYKVGDGLKINLFKSPFRIQVENSCHNIQKSIPFVLIFTMGSIGRSYFDATSRSLSHPRLRNSQGEEGGTSYLANILRDFPHIR